MKLDALRKRFRNVCTCPPWWFFGKPPKGHHHTCERHGEETERASSPEMGLSAYGGLTAPAAIYDDGSCMICCGGPEVDHSGCQPPREGMVRNDGNTAWVEVVPMKSEDVPLVVCTCLNALKTIDGEIHMGPHHALLCPMHDDKYECTCTTSAVSYHDPIGCFRARAQAVSTK